jgi:hypothetical protein
MERKVALSCLAAAKRLIGTEKPIVWEILKTHVSWSDRTRAIEMSFEKARSGILRLLGFSIERFSKTVVCKNEPMIY